MNLKHTLTDLRNRPEGQRKLIVWIVTGIVAIGALVWWVWDVQQSLSGIGEGNANGEENSAFEGVGDGFRDTSGLDTLKELEVTEEEKQQAEEMLKQLEEQQNEEETQEEEIP